MIIYYLLKAQVFLVKAIISCLTAIPGMNAISEAIQPYTTALANLIESGGALIGYFLPLGLLKVLIPIVLAIEIACESFSLIQWIYNKIRGC